jgi:predicted nucleotidyltransferase
MAKTALNITPHAMTVYRATARRRWEKEERDLAQLKARAWEIARQAAKLLKEQFGATRVVVFGSLAHEHWFSKTSDVDLAAWGLKTEDYFHIVGKLQDLSTEFEIDLVEMKQCKPSLQKAIEKEGKTL